VDAGQVVADGLQADRLLHDVAGRKIEECKDPSSVGLGYAYQGPLKSAFAPAAANPGMSVPDPAGTPAAESKKPVRLVVFGDSDFASDEYLQMARFLPIYQSGAQLLFNAISWTLEDEALTPVRSKTVASRPIQIESDKKVTTLKAVNVAGVPLLFCAFGLFRWRVAGPTGKARSSSRSRQSPSPPPHPSPRAARHESKTLIAFAAFAVLIVAAIAALRAPDKGDRRGEAPRPIAKLKNTDFDSIEVTRNRATTVIRKEGGKFKVVSPTPYAADENNAKQAFEALEKLEFGDVVTDQTTKHAEFEVGDDALRVGAKNAPSRSPSYWSERASAAAPWCGSPQGRRVASERRRQVHLRQAARRLARQEHHHLRPGRRREDRHQE